MRAEHYSEKKTARRILLLCTAEQQMIMVKSK